jgi:hypothetical protein
VRSWGQLTRLADQVPELSSGRATALLISIERAHSYRTFTDEELVDECRTALSGPYPIPMPRHERRF